MNLWTRAAFMLIRLHPPAWRQRYADEVRTLVDADASRPGLAADLALSALSEWSRAGGASLLAFGRTLGLAVARLTVASILSWMVVAAGLQWLEPPPWPVDAAFRVVLAGPMAQAALAALAVSSFEWTRRRPVLARLAVVAAFVWLFVRFSSPAGVLVGAAGGWVFALVILSGIRGDERREAPGKVFHPLSAWMATTSVFVLVSVILEVVGLWTRGHATYPLIRHSIEPIASLSPFFAPGIAVFGGACVLLASGVASVLSWSAIVRARPLLGWLATFAVCWAPSLPGRMPAGMIAMAVLSWLFASSRFDRTWRCGEPPGGVTAQSPAQRHRSAAGRALARFRHFELVSALAAVTIAAGVSYIVLLAFLHITGVNPGDARRNPMLIAQWALAPALLTVFAAVLFASSRIPRSLGPRVPFQQVTP
jgi:hypothetical protein